MNQLSDPRKYGPMFRAIGLVSEEEASNTSSPTSQGIPVEWLESSNDQIAQDLADVWQTLLQKLSADQISSISHRYSKETAAVDAKGDMTLSQMDRNIADAWRAIDAQVGRWREAKGDIATAFKIHTFVHRWKKLREGAAPNALDGDLLDALRIALEK